MHRQFPASRAIYCVSIALAACILTPPASSRERPRAVWDLAKSWREATPTRERISINGMWRWRPAEGATSAIPSGGWGLLRVPESWPSQPGGPELFWAHPDWEKENVSAVKTAWHQREITIPAEWAGRRITLVAEYVNSYAVVYIDGAKAGEIRYPAGEVDITRVVRPGRTHVLSMLVTAMPLKAVMLSYHDTASSKEVEGTVARRGLCGDVYLSSSAAGPRITDIKIGTSVRKWQIDFNTALASLDANSRYRLRARILDGNQQAEEFTSLPFGSGDLADSRILFAEHWRPAKLWDTITPRNQYTLSLSLLDSSGKLLDTALPIPFGFREFWIEGRDFYLNGTRIFLSAAPLDNAQKGSVQASYDATRAALQRLKSFGINFVYTHNYGCEPGAHLGFEEVLRAADDEGMLVAFSQPHFGHYDWTAPDADRTNGYAQHAAFYVHVAQNHPAIVCYSTSHNSTGYSEDMNPDMIDGIQNPRDPWALRNASRALRAEAIIHRLDPTRIVYHHSSGNLGAMHTMNFYGNWIPAQEMADWFEHWATLGVKPVFTCEYSVPMLWDWAMYRGWDQGKREFGAAAVQWDLEVAEWDAQFFGDRAYRINEVEKTNLRWEAEQYRAGRRWHRNDYPQGQGVGSQAFDDRFAVVAGYVTDSLRAFRTWEVSATSPIWDWQEYWKDAKRKAKTDDLALDVNWDKLQRPGPRPVYVDEEAARARLAFHATDYEPTSTADAVYRNNMPLLAYIAGKPDAFTSKDHNFLPGEAVEKQIVVVNNSRKTVSADYAWSLGLTPVITGAGKLTLPTGEQQRLALRFKLPADLAAGRYQIQTTVRFSTGETQTDSLAVDVLPRPATVQAGVKIALFDPKGETAKLLGTLGIHAERVDATADLAQFDVLVVGKSALTEQSAAPDISRVRAGLKVVVFEQTTQVLEKRFGFRIAEYGMRWVFPRVPGHPLLAGITQEYLRDWRGASTLLPPSRSYERSALFNYAPVVKWAGIPETRVWRAGNRGSVASVMIEKPARGDFLPIMDGGYNLQYSPLLEFREGQGLVLFCQMDITGRSESDPAAEILARNIVRYVSAWKPDVSRDVVYAGDPDGLKYLQSAGVAAIPYGAGELSAARVLVVGPDGGTKLAPDASRIADWLKSGGHVLAIGLGEKEANSFLPAPVSMSMKEHIAAWFESPGRGSPFTGISPAEVHNRDPRTVPLVAGGAETLGDGVLAEAQHGQIVFWQLAPWQFVYSPGEHMNVKRTFRRVACATARLLANQGAAGATPFLGRFSHPVAENEKRWLDGFYLDIPEELDDPYRFFRW